MGGSQPIELILRGITPFEKHFSIVMEAHYEERSRALPGNRWIKQTLKDYRRRITTATMITHDTERE